MTLKEWPRSASRGGRQREENRLRIRRPTVSNVTREGIATASAIAFRASIGTRAIVDTSSGCTGIENLNVNLVWVSAANVLSGNLAATEEYLCVFKFG